MTNVPESDNDLTCERCEVRKLRVPRGCPTRAGFKNGVGPASPLPNATQACPHFLLLTTSPHGMNGPPGTNGTRPSDIPSLAPSSAALTRGHSCQRCQRRKIKCDGRDPCHSCSKSGSDCIRRAKNRTVDGRITKASRSVEFPQTVRRTQSPPPPDDFRHELHLVPPPAPANFPNSGGLDFDTCRLVTPTPETQEPK